GGGKHADGPVPPAARWGGGRPDAARAGGKGAAAEAVRRLAAVMGPGRLYLDVQRHGDRAEEHSNRLLRDLAAAFRLPVIATNDVRYHSADRGRVHDVLAAIREHVTLDAAGRRLAPAHRLHLDTPAGMAARFADDPGPIRETARLAERLACSFDGTGYSFPRFPAPPGETEFSLLHDLVHRGVRERYRPVTPRVMRQVAHELDLIHKLDLAGYFLLVWDVARFCKENGILAQGRGSAANSSVCYSLGITAVDPIAFELLFERFLSEERGEWPDIDLDLPSGDDREKVIQYVYKRYGERSVGMTATVITYQARMAAREVGKVLGLDHARIDRLTHLLGYREHKAHREEADGLAARVREAGLDPADPRVVRFMDAFEDVRDLPRHLSQHNGGLIIAGGRLDRVVPLEPARMPGRTVIQWDKDDVADLRLIKVDLLGLGMLAAIDESVRLVSRHEGVEVDLAHLPPDDPAVYAALRKADTVGVFQVESRAQMATLPRMKPERFYDLVVEVAIIRPGPIVGKMVHPYLNRRAGREIVTYAHPRLEPILARTLGVPLFQEQLMRMAMAVADFTGGQAEELRRALGSRRSKSRMDRMVGQLHEGMTRNGIPPAAQEEIVRSIESFALYGFPESHAASFALIAYASAWLKVHHPAAFCCALLNQWPMGFYHPATLVNDAVRHGVEVRPVDATVSGWDCGLESCGAPPRGPTDAVPAMAIRLGIKYVKGLSKRAGEAIVAERAIRPFEGVTDLGRRSGATSAELFALAEAGTLAALGSGGRRDAMWQALAAGAARDLLRGTVRETPDPALPPMTSADEMLADFQGTGLTTGPHPVSFLRERLASSGFLPASALDGMADGRWVKVGGMILVRQRPGTARGFYFATVEDETGFANVVVTPDLFTANRALLSTASFLGFEGRLQNRDGVTSVKARRFHELGGPFRHPSRDYF
ncbi:MAG: error-prone DNA polymerase, partial [Deltaproteobacteria bacterium]|nr:error-prone DNA polymerase [Deltaproteobacteria bacterium]